MHYQKGRRAAAITAATLAAMLAAETINAKSGPGEWKAPPREENRPNPIPADAKSVAAGKSLYVKHCIACHGMGGRGDGAEGRDLEPPPADLTSAEVAAESDGGLHWKIAEGRRPMPSSRRTLSDDERWHVINYIRTLHPKQK
jgi:mono/diheme cytochrome c family protein